MAETGSVLLAEDDESVVKLFELVAKKFGVSIVHAQDGTEAYRKIQKQDFDLVITDIKMPKMDGIKFIHKIRSIPKFEKFPFFICSANLNEFEPEVAILERVHVVEKPISIKTIEKIFKTKFASGDQQVTKVDKDSIQKNLIEDLYEKAALLYQIMAKVKPTPERLDDLSGPELIKDNFIMYNHFNIMHSHFDVFVSVDEKLGKKIFKAFTKSENLNPMAIDFLNKLCLTLINKVVEALEADGLDVSFRTSSFIGNLESPSFTLIPKGRNYTKIICNTDAGELGLYIIPQQ